MEIVTMVLLGITVLLNIANLVLEVVLRYSQIAEWFRSRRGVRSRGYGAADRRRLGFTLQDLLANGEYRTVQGVFDAGTGEVEAGVRSIRSRAVDSTMRSIHAGDRLAIYP
ncbi:hypothetical protein ACFXHA_43990 [Nocardia sp. NPDC059240]|uniref:hypothetical protein n=1 Tax=Nocardia sp. NPDC059240 TaxID=3346786 RepID=UPI00369A31B2